MNILDLVTIKSNGLEYQYIDRAQAFIDLTKRFKGRTVEVTYHSPATEKLVSEFYHVCNKGRVKQLKSDALISNELDLAC